MTTPEPELPAGGRLEYPGIELGSATIDLDTGEIVEPVGAAADDAGALGSHAEPRSFAAPGSGALTWSAEKPKRRGWWWMELAGKRYVVEIIVLLGSLTVCCPWWVPAKLSEFDDVETRWAGPLVEPEEASDSPPLPNDSSSAAKPRGENL